MERDRPRYESQNRYDTNNRYQQYRQYQQSEQERYMQPAMNEYQKCCRPVASQQQPPAAARKSLPIKAKLLQVHRWIEGVFPGDATQLADRLAQITPYTLAISYVLVIGGILASRYQILWATGYLWGIATLSAVMIAVFLWIWSSNVVMITTLAEESRTRLQRAMKIQSSAFVVAILTIAYFLGMVFGMW
jgi:hypothetical protein